MIIDHLNYLNDRYSCPIQASIELSRDWIVRRLNDEAPRVLEFQRELARSVLREFMTPPRESSHCLKILGGS